VRSDAEPRNSPEALTNRHHAVLSAVVEGLADKEIAACVHISEALVKATLQQLFESMVSRGQCLPKGIHWYFRRIRNSNLSFSPRPATSARDAAIVPETAAHRTGPGSVLAHPQGRDARRKCDLRQLLRNPVRPRNPRGLGWSAPAGEDSGFTLSAE
jgi:hypothetical protein